MSAYLSCLLFGWLLLAVFLVLIDDLLSNLDGIADFLDRLVNLAIKWEQR